VQLLRRLLRKVNYFWGPRLMSELRMRWVIFKNPQAEVRFEAYCRLGPGFSLELGDGARFLVGKYNDFRRGFRAEVSPGGTVRIGDLCVFSYYSLIQCGQSIEIGDRAMFGQSSIVVDGNHQFRNVSKPLAESGYDYKPIKIENDVTTLTKVTVVDSIGTKATVGANSVVSKPIPAYTLAAGVPARILDYFGPPELTPPEWEERRRQKGIPDPPVKPGRLEVSGHSIPFGGGVSAFEHRFSSRLAELLGVEEMNRAVSGSIACWHDTGGELGDGGYAHVLREFTRPPDCAARSIERSVAVTGYGLNDLALLGPDNLGPFVHALRTVISRHRATAVFEEDDPTVTPNGDWERRPWEGDCSGAGVVESRMVGASLEIAVPSEFPGGVVALGFVARPEGGRVSFALDGDEAGELDLRGTTDPMQGRRNGVVVRRTGIGPGAHTVTCTIAEADGPVAFDYWQVEPEQGATVLVLLAYRMRDWGFHYSDWPHPPGDADVPALNDAIRAVVAEFGGSAVAVELDGILSKREELFSSEGVYPNDRGHGLIADALANAARESGSRQGAGVSVR
jgi:acetyltransferase-like isoleucine patch superfamily enzyme